MQLLARCAAWLLLASCVHASRFVIMRHGETNHNSLGIIQGSSDVSRLTEQGLEQARSAGVALAHPQSSFVLSVSYYPCRTFRVEQLL
jgi:broad specificity phosphatase PhoE